MIAREAASVGQSIGLSAVVLLSLVGVLAGFLNTVASSGSALTLPTMIELGLHPAMANATNRVPIALGCAVAVWKFHQAGQLPGDGDHGCHRRPSWRQSAWPSGTCDGPRPALHSVTLLIVVTSEL